MSDKDESDKKPPATNAAEEDDDDNSDVEMEGMDMDDDDEAEETPDEEDANNATTAAAAAVPESPSKALPISKEKEHELEEEEAKEMEAARNERLELMQRERDQLQDQAAPKDAASKLDYLLGQSEVFAHFMAGSVAAATTDKRRKKTGKSSARGRMTEAEEDAQMLKSAASTRRLVRLEKQPTILADHCKMHKYQIEGLNFLIHLHDNALHGILADEMGLGKTLQTISLLAYLRETRGMKGPHLVVVPKSVVGA